MRTMIIAALLLVALPASAQERKTANLFADLAPYVVLIAGNTADIVTTGQCFQRPGCHEGNWLTETNQIRGLAASKACAVIAEAMAMHLLAVHGHPRIGKAIGYGVGALTLGLAVRNNGVAR